MLNALNSLTTKAYIKTTEAIREFKNNQQGVTAIEYGLIAVAVAVLIIAVFYKEGGFIDKLKAQFAELAKTVGGESLKKTGN
ncbi:Flp family type IVb pilin [Aggregatibacter kilianii]|jgi:fimbrial protein flp|uniref:Flp family type IVb pilin n=1 Tax=Aggregatibacter kilianii TaxID=2025884 RepID=UPI000D65C1A3|nr:Flp family type IVb pilin [Aggregatibacter kilianii]RDE85088.1 Flp family type IVb pilin [Aggregatibacter aphrophilus]RDE95940.1 Flp family type IVb pilin [Aggregatibacter aphrophilus]RDE97734.1 Flp family type IVb pilin [Aggregatibacter aphrophilus]